MTITGAVYPAIDLTAGERERGTLEMLVASPVPRMQLLLGKYFAVLIVALLTAVVNLAAMMVTIASIGMAPLLFGTKGISFEEVLEIMALLVLFAAFFSAVLLAVTSFARSFKEAQAYLIPLMLASIAPGMLSMIPGLKLQGPLVVTPLVNIVLLARDLLQHNVDPVTAFWVVISTGLFALAAIGVAARIFGTDAILYGSHGTWSDLFRRPRRSSAAPTPTSAPIVPGDHLSDVFSRVESAEPIDFGRIGRPAAAGGSRHDPGVLADSAGAGRAQPRRSVDRLPTAIRHRSRYLQGRWCSASRCGPSRISFSSGSVSGR